MTTTVQQQPAEQRLITVSEAARLLGLNRFTVYFWCREGKFPCVRMGTRTVRVPLAAVQQLLRQAEPQPGQAG